MSSFCTGVIPPLTTPFDAGGALRIGQLERNFESYLEFPLAGFLLLGSTGEALHLERKERLEVVRAACSALPRERLLLVGVAEASLRQALSFIDEIAGFRVDGLLVGTPHYYRKHTSRKGLVEFFSTLAERSPFPVLLYNFPQCTGVELAPDLVGELAARPNIAGIKDSSGSIVYLQKILRATEAADFQVISGSAEVVQPAWQLGVRGGIYAAACVVPELTLDLTSHWLGSGVDDVEGLQQQLFLLSSTIVGGLGIPGIKYAMDRRGWCGGAPRLPFLPLGEEDGRRVESALETVLVSR